MYSYRALLRLELAVPEKLAEGTLVEMFRRRWQVVEVLEDAVDGRPGFLVCSPEPEDLRAEATLPAET